jgi:hypothetical protein
VLRVQGTPRCKWIRVLRTPLQSTETLTNNMIRHFADQTLFGSGSKVKGVGIGFECPELRVQDSGFTFQGFLF